jgi:peptidylglycine monooxygenase
MYFLTGKVVSGWKVTNGKEWSLIGKRSPQQPQMFYPVEDPTMTLTKGDIMAARCTMVNNRDRTTYIGMTNKDEMCNFYVMYWVKGKEPVADHTCFSAGPPMWSWRNNAMLENIPDEEASTL